MNYIDELENGYSEVTNTKGLMSRHSVCQICAWKIDADSCQAFDEIPRKYKMGNELHFSMDDGEILTWVPKIQGDKGTFF
jgi:hypothetical protein